jgi:hypothetical protein
MAGSATIPGIDTKMDLSLTAIVRQEVDRPVPAAVATIAEAARQRHGNAVTAVIFYGSCLRRPETINDGIVDLYLLVSSCRAAGLGSIAAGACRLLPPNVYYLEAKHEGVSVRAKYALMHRDDFIRAARHWFQPYIWARFAQPCRLLWARDERERKLIIDALAAAVRRFINQVRPLMPAPFTARELWLTGFARSYNTELRAESSEHGAKLYAAAADFYDQAAGSVLGVSEPIADGARPRYDAPRGRWTGIGHRIVWHLRRWQSKLLSVLRLLKAFFTFTDGPAYLVWKIRRHNPDLITPDDRLRQRPSALLGILIWRLYRRQRRHR